MAQLLFFFSHVGGGQGIEEEPSAFSKQRCRPTMRVCRGAAARTYMSLWMSPGARCLIATINYHACRRRR